MKKIEFIDLAAQRAYLGTRIDRAMLRVVDHGNFIMGPEVKAFEAELAAFGEADHVVSCSNGTDALVLPLKAWNIGPGDAVFVPSFTFAATAEVVAMVGATPVFVEVREDTFNMDAGHLEQMIDQVREAGKLRPRAVIAVDLFGQIADYEMIGSVTRAAGMKLIADAAQGFGSTWHGRHAAAVADVVSTSFFPAKPLGCYGDGGAVLTSDADLAEVMRSLRVHGKGSDKYDNVRIGMNARLDTLQASILIEKLSIFAEEIEKRNKVAARYTAALHNQVRCPVVPEGVVSTWAQYTLRLENRDAVQESLKEAGIPSVVYYPRPLHRQSAYSTYSTGDLPVSERLSQEVLSLPMHPYLDEETQDYIIGHVQAAVGTRD